MSNIALFSWSFFLFLIINIIIRFFIYKINKLKRQSEYLLLVNVFKADVSKISDLSLVFILSFCNAFILSNTFVIISSLKIGATLTFFALLFLMIILFAMVYYVVALLLGKKR